MSDLYADELAELFRRHGVSGDPTTEGALAAEIERRGLKVEQSQRVDLSASTGGPAYAVRLLDGNGSQVAYSVGDHHRQAAINALRRHLEGKPGRDI